MTTQIAYDPYATGQPLSTFLTETQGYIQGFAEDDPSLRMELMRGTLDPTETLPMWGGVPITEFVNLMGVNAEGLGPSVKRATAQGNVTGWSVFNQAASMVLVQGNAVPIALSSAVGAGNFVAFFRNYSGLRIAVQIDPALYTTLAAVAAPGDNILQPALYWDVTNYRVTLTTSGGNFALPSNARLLSANQNSKIVSWASSAATWGQGTVGLLLI